MDVHAGGQPDIHHGGNGLVAHIFADGLNELGVPCTGLEGGAGPVCRPVGGESDARRAVGGVGGEDAVLFADAV